MPESDADQVWRQMREVYAGFLAGDPAAVDALLAADVTLWDSAEPELVRGLTDLRALRSRRPASESAAVAQILATDPIIDVWGDTALLRHRVRIVFAEDRADQLLRNTSVWRRTGSGWRAVHNHEDVLEG